jgi:hypothetical protein
MTATLLHRSRRCGSRPAVANQSLIWRNLGAEPPIDRGDPGGVLNPEREQSHAVPTGRIDQNRKVEMAAVQFAFELVADRDDIFRLQQRIVLAHRLKQLWQAGHCEAFGETHADAAADGGGVGLKPDPVGFLEQGCSTRHKGEALGRQCKAAPIFLEQRDVEGSFEIAQAQRNRRLRHVEMAGGLVQGAELSGPEKRLELSDREAH